MKKLALIAIAFAVSCSEEQTQAVSDFKTTGREPAQYMVDQFRTYKVYDDVVGKGLILTLAPLGVTNSRPVPSAGTAPELFIDRHVTAAALHLQATGRSNCSAVVQTEIALGQFIHKVSC